jgi:hypothetical protein
MQALLDLASGVIRRYAHQTISEVLGDTVEFGPANHRTLFLPEIPVLNVTSVTVGVTAVTEVVWYRGGQLIGETAWDDGAVVVYDHGWAAGSDTIAAVKAVCLAAASRAFTMNERSASEVLGATLMETAGYAPEVFLTAGERELLNDLGAVPVG